MNKHFSKETTFYSVHKGHKPGIYQTWTECEKQVKGYKLPVFKKLNNYEQAKEFREKGKVLFVASSTENRGQKNKKRRGTSDSSTKNPESILRSGDIAVYTDGASSFNGKPNCRAGYGVYFPLACHLNASGKLEKGPNGELPSNQRAELIGCIEAIKIINKEYPEETGILLITDSKYSLQCVYPHETKYKNGICQAWASKWKKNEWKTGTGDPVKNRDLVEELYDLVQERNLDPDRGQLRFLHVYGHNNVHGNECADRLAREGKDKCIKE